MSKNWLNVKEVAEYMGISVKKAEFIIRAYKKKINGISYVARRVTYGNLDRYKSIEG